MPNMTRVLQAAKTAGGAYVVRLLDHGPTVGYSVRVEYRGKRVGGGAYLPSMPTEALAAFRRHAGAYGARVPMTALVGTEVAE